MAIVSRVVPESIFTLAKLEVPIHIIQPWLNRLKDGSVITALSSRKGLPYGDSKWLKFSDGEAQYVEEGQAKLGSSVKVTSGTAKTFKFQKRIRFSDEVLYAAHEEQMHLLQQVLDDMVGALSRALDYGIIHAIDPGVGPRLSG